MDQKYVDFAIQLAVILFAISFHESAHAWAALQFGDTTARDQGRISLNPIHHIDLFGSVILPILLYFTSGMIFGYAKPTPVDLRNTRNPRLANLWVSAAGPLSNLLLTVLGIVFLFVLRRLNPGSSIGEGVVAPLWAVGISFVVVNFSLAVFNLLPLPPLDGSHVAESVFGDPVVRLFQVITPQIGFLILIGLSYSGILGAVMRPAFSFLSAVVRIVVG